MSDFSKRIVKQTEALLHFQHDETLQETTPERLHEALGQVIMMEISDNWTKTKRRQAPGRRAFYFSAEYLVGRLVYSNLFNLGILREIKAAFAEKGVDLACLEHIEDAALGNGGLGRLAACFLDSAATLDLSLTGYGLRYRFGLFKQSFVGGCQREDADDWTKYGDPWSHRRDKLAVKVHFADQTVNCVPYDMPVIGYETSTVGTLRLWQCEAEEELNFDAFNAQDYVKALEKKNKAEDITRVLYPNDSTWEGKRLRVKQQYVLSSASLQDILRDYRAQHGADYYRLPEFVAVQLNDTHPAMSIPELIRLLMNEGLDFDAAFELTRRVFAYTNHTVMSEALEKWPQDLVQTLLPRVWEILCEINRRWCEYLVSKFGNSEKVGKNLIIQDGQVHMANLCLAACYKINGVSGLHGEILKKDLFKDVCQLRPERFTYVTNGIDHRRWLAQINPRLHGLVSELLEGDDYLTKPEKLIGLLDYAENVDVQRRVNEIKRLNKYDFAKFLAKNDGFALDPDAILDVQVKRLHEYKRQLLCAMLITRLQMKIHDDPNADFMPVTFVFGAKAAAGYYTAKRIIELICSLADDISRDPLCKGKLQVCFMENYRVSAAEALMPAAQVSEQISTAGKEASGTGNMKLMLNGAVTIGTLDGANVEMYERLGDKNMFLFGLKTDEVGALKASGYDPQRYAREDAELGAVLDRISRGFADGKSYSDLVSNLLYNGDPYMLCADFRDYVNTHDRMYSVISDPAERARLSITNTAEAGIFAADRAIKEYAEGIWGIKL